MANLVGSSDDPGVAAVFGEHTAGAGAVIGQSNKGRGVIGSSLEGQGVWGVSDSSTGTVGESKSGWGTSGSSDSGPGVVGLSNQFNAVRGIGHAAGHGAVVGINDNQSSDGGPGVYGQSRAAGVLGESETWHGVGGISKSTTGGAGVYGRADQAGVGVFGESGAGIGVIGKGGVLPGRFEGNVLVDGNVEATGDLRLLGADVAEQFDVLDDVDPGTIVVLDDDGAIGPCRKAYDRRVAGVVSGAGDRRPALVLDRQDSGARRRAVAMLGKAWRRADASTRPVEVGDLLTTSTTAGHAMTAVDRDASFGAVLGKALTPLATGTGLVLVLVGLG